MKKSQNDEAQRWLQQARADFEAGEYLIQGKKFYLACFVFQQAAEKALKAYLYARGEDWVIGHSVQKLCLECSKYDSVFKELGEEVNGLDGYYIPTRYPNSLPDGIPADVYTRSDAERTRAMCDKIIKFVLDRIPE